MSPRRLLALIGGVVQPGLPGYRHRCAQLEQAKVTPGGFGELAPVLERHREDQTADCGAGILRPLLKLDYLKQ